MKSKITGGETKLLFSDTLLGKYTVKYFQCIETGYIQTESPYWLEEAYSSAITKLDIGLVYRNEFLRDTLIPIIATNLNANAIFLDYAGGYGLFTRMMRDKGFNFFHTDMYCQNIFAEYFDLEDLSADQSFEALTAFEVLEHMVDPVEEINEMFRYSDTLIVTTELIPEKPCASAADWWYFSPETGQHISFYTKSSLEYIANKKGYNFHTNGSNLHIFTKKRLNGNPFVVERPQFFKRHLIKIAKKLQKDYTKQSLLAKDWEYVKKKLASNNSQRF